MNKIDIFNANAEFFERFNNSSQDTTRDRLGRPRITVTAVEKIKKENDNLLKDMQKVANDFKDETQSIGAGKWVKESLIANKMNVGDFGSVGARSEDYGSTIGRDFNNIEIINRSFTVSGHWLNNPITVVERSFHGIATIVTRRFNIGVVARLDFYENSRHWYRHFNGTEWSNWYEMYGTSNTTVDSNGFIKAASPVLRLFNDRIETNDQFTEEPMFEKLDMGVYKISNTLGLAKEGWYIETPKDKNGLPYFMVDWEQDEKSHDVIIRVFKKKLDLETLDFVNGDPVDISEEQRWIDLRFHEEPQEIDSE